MMAVSTTRRAFLAGSGAALLTSTALASGGSATRVFGIWRDGSEIGEQRLEARLTDRGFEIDIKADIAVKLLGLTAYRYTLENREVWRDRRIVSVDSSCNDDGDREYVQVRRRDDRLEIDASGYSGTQPLEAVTTSYFSPAFRGRTPWISTQSGKPLDIRVDKRGADTWAVRGDLTVDLTYRDGEWRGAEFTIDGDRIVYETRRSTGEIAQLWRQA